MSCAPPIYRLAVPAERSALEDLQRRASLIWEEGREALLAHPAQWRLLGGYTVGEVAARLRPAPRVRKSIDVG